jgi:hypothetical protein
MGEGESNAEHPPAGTIGTTNGRDARGLFGKGNQFARGNAGRARMARLRAALVGCATLEKLRAVEAA